MTATAEARVFQAGVYDGMAEETYHGDPVPGGSLSSSGARKLLPPSCPARFRYEADNPPPPKEHFDYGSAAHRLVLGAGAEIYAIDAKDWRTRAAQEERDLARAEGFLPMLAGDYEQVQAMAAALRAHPVASALFNPERGKPEQSLFWQDRLSGIWRRARYDWLADAGARERLIIPDYKTTTAADPDSIAKWIARYRYYFAAAWYLDGAVALGLDADPVFVFCFQEKEPPYLVNTVQLDADALRLGRELNRDAIGVYAACTERGEWPGYEVRLDRGGRMVPDPIPTISLPAWELRQLEEVAW